MNMISHACDLSVIILKEKCVLLGWTRPVIQVGDHLPGQFEGVKHWGEIEMLGD